MKVSCIGLGTWVTFANQISDAVAEEIMNIAFENGINHFDTAEVYSGGRAEILLGSIIKKRKWRRSSFVISTKLFWGGRAETERGLSRKHIIEGLYGSLQRLQLQYVDVVYANKADPSTSIEEIVRAFSFLINQGKAMYWGTSRWSASEILQAHSIARQFNLIPPVVEQAEYNIFQRDMVEQHMPFIQTNIGIKALGFSPLAGGILSGKYMNGTPDESRANLKGYNWFLNNILCENGQRQQVKVKQLKIVSDRLGCTLSQLAIAWCLRNENLSGVLVGVSSCEQLYENLKSLNFLPKICNPEVLKEIDSIIGI